MKLSGHSACSERVLLRFTNNTVYNIYMCLNLHIRFSMNYEQNLQTEQFLNSFMLNTVPAIFHFPSADSCMPQQPEKYKYQVLKILTFFSHLQIYLHCSLNHVYNIFDIIIKDLFIVIQPAL